MVLAQFQAPPRFDAYVNALSLEDAVRALADGRGVPVAGGTDLWVKKEQPGAVAGDRLVNVRSVPELGGIAAAAGRVRLGALVTMTEILEHDRLTEVAPILALAADRFASVQIRNAATLGGNLANASPAADLAPPLLSLEASVELARWDGGVARRQVALDAFFTGPGQTIATPDELLVAITFRPPPARHVAAFHKTGPRPALEIARVSLALVAGVADGRLVTPRIACGAVAPTPVRCPGTEALLDGAILDDDTIGRALAALDGEISPIADSRASPWYRRHLARTFLEQELRHVRDG